MLPTEQPTRDLPQVGQSILSGLGSFFDVTLDILDRPGNAMRGVLTGNPQALLGLLPFSESISTAMGHDFTRISGEEMLQKWGVEGAGFWSGLTAEVLTDPLLLLGTGGLTKLGAATKAFKGGSAEWRALKAFEKVAKKTDPSYIRRINKPNLQTVREAGKIMGSANRKLAKAGKLSNERALIRVPFTDIEAGKFSMPEVWKKIPGHAAMGAAVDKVFKALPEDSVLRNMYDLEKNLVKRKQRRAQRLVRKHKDKFNKKWGDKIDDLAKLPEFADHSRDEIEVLILEKGFPDAADKYDRIKQIVDGVRHYTGETPISPTSDFTTRLAAEVTRAERGTLDKLENLATSLTKGNHTEGISLMRAMFTALERGDKPGRQALKKWAVDSGLEGPAADKYVDQLLGEVNKLKPEWKTTAGEVGWSADDGMFVRRRISSIREMPPEWQKLRYQSEHFAAAWRAFRKGQWEAGDKALDNLIEAEAIDIARIELIKKEFGDSIFNDMDILESLYGGFLKEARDIGLPIRNLDHPMLRYHYHMVTPDGWDFLKANRDNSKVHRFMQQIIVTRTGSRKARGQTINQINDYMRKEGYSGVAPFMETDIWRAASRRAEHHAMQVYQKNHIEAVFEHFGYRSLREAKAANPKGKFKRLSDVLRERNYRAHKGKQWDLADTKKTDRLKGVKWQGTKGKQKIREIMKGEDRWIPQEMWDDAMTPFNVMKTPKAYSTFLKHWNGWAAVYRSAVTSVFPAYHTRNIIGNIWNAAVIGPMKNPVHYKNAWSLQRKFARAMTTGDKSVLSRAEWKAIKEMQEAGVMRENTFQDIQHFFQLEAAEGKMVGFAQDPVDRILRATTGRGKAELLGAKLPFARDLMPTGYKFGMIFENNARMALFMSERKAGKSVIESANTVRKYLFNYEELSQIEQKFLKPYAFFYTFTRKNTPLLMQNLLAPGSRIWAASLPDPAEGTPAWVDEANSWILKQIDEDGMFRTLDLGLPIQELGRENLLARLHPLIKAPLEVATDRDFFTGQAKSEMTQAPNLIRGLAALVGKDNTVLKKLLSYQETTNDRTGKTYATVDPLVNTVIGATPLSRALGTEVIPKTTGAETIGRLLGVNLRTREVSPRRMNFNKIQSALKILESQGRVRRGDYYFATDKNDPLAKDYTRFLNKR